MIAEKKKLLSWNKKNVLDGSIAFLELNLFSVSGPEGWEVMCINQLNTYKFYKIKLMVSTSLVTDDLWM